MKLFGARSRISSRNGRSASVCRRCPRATRWPLFAGSGSNSTTAYRKRNFYTTQSIPSPVTVASAPTWAKAPSNNGLPASLSFAASKCLLFHANQRQCVLGNCPRDSRNFRAASTASAKWGYSERSSGCSSSNPWRLSHGGLKFGSFKGAVKNASIASPY